MRSTTLLTRLLLPVAATAAAVLAVPAIATAAPASGRPAKDPHLPPCAWLEFSAATNNTLRPDTAAVYWVLPFTVQPGLSIKLHGRFPDSRYTSLQAYNHLGQLFTTNGVRSDLPDYLIQPDPGSVNPWQHRAPAGGHFTVTAASDAAPGQPNTLPLAPPGPPRASASCSTASTCPRAGTSPGCRCPS